MNNRKSGTMVLERPITARPLTDIPGGDPDPKSACRHYWLIDKPDGPLSHGVCRFCHEERDFSNTPPQFTNHMSIKIF
jgi:hypothetical protein